LLGPCRLQTLFDWHRHRVAVPTRITHPDRSEDEKSGRLEVELFGRLRADAHPHSTTTPAEFFGLGQIVDNIASLEMFGYRRATMLIATAGRLVGGGLGRWGAFFRSTSKTVFQSRIEFGLECRVLGTEFGEFRFEFGILGTGLGEFGEEFADHRLKCGDIIRQRSVRSQERGIHACLNTVGLAR
jgi:hypothetical protein